MSRLEDRVEIASPQHPHRATVLLLDTSGSMQEHARIDQLNEGLRQLVADLREDDLARKRVDLAVITFGADVALAHPFASPMEFDPPTLTANGSTPMGQALVQGMELLEDRKQEYKAYGTDYYRPWLFLLTDGGPTDMAPGHARWNDVIRRVHEGVANKRFLFFVIGTEDADFHILRQIAPPLPPDAGYHNVMTIKEGKFGAFFKWMSKSQSAVASSQVGKQLLIEAPAAAGWGLPTS